MKAHLLYVEDDESLSFVTRDNLELQGYKITYCPDGKTALDEIRNQNFDLCILDVMLPRKDGLAVCRELRASGSSVPVLMLTARDALEDRVAGLNSGADDYLVKPFAFEELLARIQALGRRFLPPASDPAELRHGDLVLDLRAHTARHGQTPLNLTSTEWNLLEVFIRHAGQSLTRQQLLDYVWSYDRDVQVTMVDVYVSYLRRKLKGAGAKDPIQTVRGVGYRLEALGV